MYIDPLYDMKLPERKERKVFMANDYKGGVDGQFYRISFQGSLVIPMLLLERGGYSKQPFRAQSNFRDVDFVKITERHGDPGQPEKYPPLQESFASGQYVDSFDSNNMVWQSRNLSM